MPIIYQNGLKIDSATGQILEVGEAPAGYQAPTNNEGLAGYDQRLADQAAARNTTGQQLMGAVGYEDPLLIAERNRQMEQSRVASQETVDEADIQRRMTERFQAEIDATNRLYAEKAAEAKVAGIGRLGSSGAIQARRGLLGSDFGASQTNIVEQSNQKEQDMINAEKNAAISQIGAKIRDNSVAEAAAKRKAISEGADAYIKYLSDASVRKVSNSKDIIKALLASKQVLDDSLADDLAAKLGMDKASFFQMYQEEKANADSAAAIAATEAEKAQIAMDTSRAGLVEKQASATAAQVGKDYEYVSTPAQRDALKKQGYTEKIVNGKTYMKAPELTTKTVSSGKNDYLVTYDKTGKMVRKELVATNAGSGAAKTTKKYNQNTIPANENADLLATIGDPNATYLDVVGAFPEVDTAYINSLWTKSQQ